MDTKEELRERIAELEARLAVVSGGDCVSMEVVRELEADNRNLTRMLDWVVYVAGQLDGGWHSSLASQLSLEDKLTGAVVRLAKRKATPLELAEYVIPIEHWSG